MGDSQVRFFTYYMWGLQIIFFCTPYGASIDQFLCILYGPPHRPVFSAYYIWGPLQINFFAYYRGAFLRSISLLFMRAPSGQSLHILYGGSLRSVSSHTIWGPLDQFLCILYGPPSDQFLCILYMGVLRSVLCLMKWGSLPVSFFA